MGIKAILFDLDGVLIDTVECWVRAFNDTYRKYGQREISKDEFIREYWGHSSEKGFKHLGSDALSYCNARQIDNLWMAKPIPGAREVLELCSKKVKLGLVTNTPKKNTLKELEMFGLKEYFDVVVTGDDVRNKKPSPDMVIEACERLGVSVDDVVMVGDTESDLLAGKSAGCRVIGVNVHADWMVKDMSELKLLLLEMLK
ncbi:MAG: HAD family hydrolase [Candidatus Hadarchaeales archaeon]